MCNIQHIILFLIQSSIIQSNLFNHHKHLLPYNNNFLNTNYKLLLNYVPTVVLIQETTPEIHNSIKKRSAPYAYESQGQ